jgi:CRP-like cAMP-binding protein
MEGQITLMKRFARMNFNDQNSFRDYNILTLGKGEIFGEDLLFYRTPNKYTAKVFSIKCKVLVIKNHFFQQYYKKSMPKIKESFDLRYTFAEQMIKNKRKNLS